MLMNIQEQIEAHIATLPEAKRADIMLLHQRILHLAPGCQLWFFDGKDESGKTVSNPNIGYGHQVLKYADGTTKAFYQIGLSANKTGYSVYILGLKDKAYLTETYGKTIGKASVTRYCINFKKCGDINPDVLDAAIMDGFQGIH